MAEVTGARTMGMSLLIGVCAFFQGFLSMGFQLVATRLLAPFPIFTLSA